MPVTMQDVRAILDPEEPRYDAIAGLGPDALPYLQAIVQGADPMLASKAVYAASLLEADIGVDVVATAASSDDPIVRVAAAAAAKNLGSEAAESVLVGLVADDDAGVRKVARSAAGDGSPVEIPDGGATSGSVGPSEDVSSLGSLMPGERPSARMAGESIGLMPGEEERGGMPGSGMPG